MAGNLSSRVRTINLTATAILTSGTFCEESGWLGIPMEDAAVDDIFALAWEGSFWVTLANATLGALVYWDGSALTLTESTNKVIGKVETITQSAAPHDGECEIVMLPFQGAVVGSA